MSQLSLLPNDVIIYIFKLIHCDLMMKLNRDYYNFIDPTWKCLYGCHCITTRSSFHFNWRLGDNTWSAMISNVNVPKNYIHQLPDNYVYSSNINAKIK